MSEQLQFWPDERPGGRLTWSVTRDKRLRDCRRRYFLQHYGSRGGFKTTASHAVRDIYVLKHLRNRHMWVGEIVHEMIELALATWRRGGAVPVDALIERGTRRMRAQYAESMQGIYRDRPREAYGLVEHEYRETIAREEWKAQRDRMERCLRHFFNLELTAQIRETPPWSWLALESMGSFELEGATVMLKPDFAYRDDDGRVILVDWKTGRPRHADEWLQMAVYGTYAQQVWDANRLCGQVAYLGTGDVRPLPIALGDLNKAGLIIRESIREMRRLVSQAEVDDLDPPAFPRTDDLSACRLCPFRRVCGRG